MPPLLGRQSWPLKPKAPRGHAETNGGAPRRAARKPFAACVSHSELAVQGINAPLDVGLTARSGVEIRQGLPNPSSRAMHCSVVVLWESPASSVTEGGMSQPAPRCSGYQRQSMLTSSARNATEEFERSQGISLDLNVVV